MPLAAQDSVNNIQCFRASKVDLFGTEDGRVWTGFNWLTTWAKDRLLWICQWVSGSHKMAAISWLACLTKRETASEGSCCYVELLSSLICCNQTTLSAKYLLKCQMLEWINTVLCLQWPSDKLKYVYLPSKLKNQFPQVFLQNVAFQWNYQWQRFLTWCNVFKPVTLHSAFSNKKDEFLLPNYCLGLNKGKVKK
jgi:hypothetical protein